MKKDNILRTGNKNCIENESPLNDILRIWHFKIFFLWFTDKFIDV